MKIMSKITKVNMFKTGSVVFYKFKFRLFKFKTWWPKLQAGVIVWDWNKCFVYKVRRGVVVKLPVQFEFDLVRLRLYKHIHPIMNELLAKKASLKIGMADSLVNQYQYVGLVWESDVRNWMETSEESFKKNTNFVLVFDENIKLVR